MSDSEACRKLTLLLKEAEAQEALAEADANRDEERARRHRRVLASLEKRAERARLDND